MAQKFEIMPPRNAERVLLHCCCAPCSSAIVEALLERDIEPVLYYYNPNIFPEAEYLKRKDECMRFAKIKGLACVDADYDHGSWLAKIKGLESEPERGKRCLECFKCRLLKAAEYARENSIGVFATTLASSRWKDLAQIQSAGLYAQEKTGVVFWAQNWRKGGLQQRRNSLIKEYDFYNQLYCGCEFSMLNGSNRSPAHLKPDQHDSPQTTTP